jgi:hypothetical protein
MILPGTYANGFAPRDGEPLFPELWRGCVGAWNPGLGPSGLTLRDWSGRGNHGTLTNMPAADGWKPSQGRYALDFDGVDDHAIINPIPFASNPEFSIYCRLQTRNNAIGQSAVMTGDEGSALRAVSIFVGTRGTGSCSMEFAGNNTFAISTGISNNTEHAIVARKMPGPINTTSQIWIDGIQRTAAAGSSTGTPNYLATRATIGQFGQAAAASRLSGLIFEVAIYNRALLPNEIRLLASRRGIAYEMAPRSWSAQQIAAYRSRYYSQIIGGGIV